MTLPPNVIRLISEYSKPLTNPDWKKGSPHANILKYSQPLINLTDMLINLIQYYNYDYNKLFDRSFMYTLLKLPCNILIQKYGEKIFDLFKSYKPNQINFYRWCRLSCYLKIVIKNDIPTKIEFY
jgi:hypothetical protein